MIEDRQIHKKWVLHNNEIQEVQLVMFLGSWCIPDSLYPYPIYPVFETKNDLLEYYIKQHQEKIEYHTKKMLEYSKEIYK